MDTITLTVSLVWLLSGVVFAVATLVGNAAGESITDYVLTHAGAAVSGLPCAAADVDAPTVPGRVRAVYFGALATRADPWSSYRSISLAELRALRAALPLPVEEKPFRLPSPADMVSTVVDAKKPALVKSEQGWATGMWPGVVPPVYECLSEVQEVM